MSNIKSIVNAHNNRISKDDVLSNNSSCNCRNRESCPLNNKCLTDNVLYAATNTSNLPHYNTKHYAGVTAPQWKFRFNTHKSSFNLQKYKNSTELSKEVWNIKDQEGTPNIKWTY